MDLAEIFLLPGRNILYASMIAMIGALFISFVSLRMQKVGIEAFFLALASLASGIWLYELVYHYAYGPNLEQVILDLQNINFQGYSYGSYSVFPLFWSLAMILLPFAGIKWMRVNWYFLTGFLGAVGTFVVWILMGFPQFFAPGWCSSWTGCRDIIVYANSQRTLVGYLANSISKLLVVSPALLFVPKGQIRAFSGFGKRVTKIFLNSK